MLYINDDGYWCWEWEVPQNEQLPNDTKRPRDKVRDEPCLRCQLQKAEAELAEMKDKYQEASDVSIERLAKRDKLLEALKPFVEVWEKRSGPNQPSVSSEMLVAVPVKHFIHAKILVDRSDD